MSDATNTPLTLDATNTPFSLSVITSTQHNASKKLIADHAGMPQTDPAHRLDISAGTIERIPLAGLAALGALIPTLTTRQALAHGVRIGSAVGDLKRLITLDAMRQRTKHGAPRPPGLMTRSKDDMTYPDGPRLIMFDVDVYEGVPSPASGEALVAQLAGIWPVCAEVGWLATVSTRSAIRNKKTGDWLTPPTGFHVYVLATGDVARFRELLRVRLWLAGTGYCRLAAPNAFTGVASILPRCLVDLTVYAPEHLDYVAGAIIAKDAPFVQDRPLPALHPGALLNLDALPDVTDDERQQYETLVQEARATVQPDRVAHVRTHIRAATPTIDDATLDQIVTERLGRADRSLLAPDHPLYFHRRRTAVTASTVTAAYDGQRLADPCEPDYRDGTDAIFHWNNGRWLVNSFAHGTLKTYRLEREAPDAPAPDPDEPWPEAEESEAADPDARTAGPYEETRAGLVWWKPSGERHRVKVPLTNFTARIVADVVEDDGADTKRYFEIEACYAGRISRFPVEAAHFAGMTWAMEHLGARAMVFPGILLKDHARAAVQTFSLGVEERHIYTHLGWRLIAETWCYLHAGGAIGPDGPVSGVEVNARGALAAYVLPACATPEDQRLALRASLRLLDTAADVVTVPLYAAIWRAVLGHADFSLHLVGPTGAGKSELAALAQQHVGAGMTARHLPAAWTSTGNALEGLAFEAKDVLLVVDDFCPSGSAADIARFHRDADRLLRAQGNHSGRMRMKFDGTLRPVRPPRGLIVSTGEDTPQGQSLRARVLILDVEPGSIQWGTVTACQADAASGVYATALAGFVQWLAPQYAEVSRGLHAEVTALRQAMLAGGHRRTPEILGNLALGMQYLLAYGQAIGALTAAECTALWQRSWDALVSAGSAQRDHQANEEPVRRFLALLSGVLAAGLAHVQDAQKLGQPSAQPEPWGWRGREYRTQHGEVEMRWDAQGPCIGWLATDRLYLEPEAAYSVVQKLAESQKAPLPVSQHTLWKRMHEQGLLIRNPSQEKNKVLRPVGDGKRRYVVDVSSHLVAAIGVENGTTGTTGTDGPQPQQNQGNIPYRFPVWPPQNRYSADTKPVQETTEISAESRNGQQSPRCTGFPTHAVPVSKPEPVQKNAPHPQQPRSGVPVVPVVPVSEAEYGHTVSAASSSSSSSRSSDSTCPHGGPHAYALMAGVRRCTRCNALAPRATRPAPDAVTPGEVDL